MGGVVVAHAAATGPARTSSSSVSEAFVVNSSKSPVVGARSAIRRTALTTPPWQHTTIVRPRWAATASRTACADAVVQLGERLAARERHGVRVGLPVGHAVALDELLERQPVAVRPGIVLAEAVVDVDLGAAERRGDQLGGLDRPRVVAGVQDDVAASSPVSASARAEPLALAAAEVGQPGARPRPADRAGHAGLGLAVAHQHQPASAAAPRTPSPGHRTDRTFRSECPAPADAPP